MGKGFDAFMNNPYWKKVYENAPGKLLKESYRIAFDNSIFILGDEYDEEKHDAELSSMHRMYGDYTSEDVKYLYDNSLGAEKSIYKKWLERIVEREKNGK